MDNIDIICWKGILTGTNDILFYSSIYCFIYLFKANSCDVKSRNNEARTKNDNNNNKQQQ